MGPTIRCMIAASFYATKMMFASSINLSARATLLSRYATDFTTSSMVPSRFIGTLRSSNNFINNKPLKGKTQNIHLILHVCVKIRVTHPPILSLPTCSGSDEKYGEPLEACSSFCLVHRTPGPINAGETAFTLILWGARSYGKGIARWWHIGMYIRTTGWHE